MIGFPADTRKPILLIGLGILLSSLVSCSTTTNRDIAERAVEKFHAQFNAESYESIQLSAAQEFKAGGTTGKAYVEKAREILGTVISTTQVAGTVQNLADETQINFVYMTTFANGKAPETFIFRVRDRRASLMFYEVALGGLTDR